ncbi:hypothetical protein [Pseudomonas granadensis]|uniref:hypothetical protein n=1 Tax=Pseudomonas granadensis TaxID=1421430 RepID=UPI00087D99CD|nr:hypothetical protein [Pseudomonas granadensis]SDT58656.1 hypothetical protein SAMN05216579_4716 [Pseudomonas granadensis]
MKIYKGEVFNSANERHPATLKFDDPAKQTGNIVNGSMDYCGLDFLVNGNCTKSTWTYNLTAKSDAKERDEENHGPSTLGIVMKSTDGTDNNLLGEVTVKFGGPNLGQTFGITFTKA